MKIGMLLTILLVLFFISMSFVVATVKEKTSELVEASYNIEFTLNDPCNSSGVYCHQFNINGGIAYLNFSSVVNGTFEYVVTT